MMSPSNARLRNGPSTCSAMAHQVVNERDSRVPAYRRENVYLGPMTHLGYHWQAVLGWRRGQESQRCEYNKLVNSINLSGFASARRRALQGREVKSTWRVLYRIRISTGLPARSFKHHRPSPQAIYIVSIYQRVVIEHSHTMVCYLANWHRIELHSRRQHDRDPDPI
ncbi:hypothetical protein DAEQUDRAFT_10917 [Daedalea quercina L-15889]|uniref:Uncharacterized protein n=1 Tax=Daedalea quercina L-15889 TaxID=1314783 RepID=A0A165UGH8_9APHY|nr:hypothetical protein DAEQUDRAFT_10917 [Daedalea quercina L-15889]